MNIDEVTLQGVEGAVRWKANRYISVFGGVGYIHSRIDSFASRPYTVGNKVPYAPEYTADAGIELNVPLSSGLALFARVDGNSIGRTWFSPVQNNQVQTLFGVPGDYSKTSRDPYTIGNARLGMSADHWSISGWVRNLTNRHYLEEVIPAPEFGGSFIHSATGRAYGVDLSYNY
jgi:iron complex outermembrane receptor protein